MSIELKYFLFLIFATILGFMAYNLIHTNKLIRIGRNQTAATAAYERPLSDPKHNILIVGDSSAVGVGAVPPEGSVAGRLAADFPTANVTSVAVSGSKVADAIKQLEGLPSDADYDLILIQIGGNDIVRRTPYQQLETDIPKLFTLAKQHSDNVIQLSCGNVGTSKLLPLGTRWYFTLRTKKVRSIFMPLATEAGVHYIDLYRPRANDPYAHDPKRYYSPDFFHPSADGYGDWYSLVKPVASELLNK